MICDICHQRGPTATVEFRQNIGLIVMRLTSKVAGDLCADCIRATFIRCSLITLFCGWWGVISFFVAPYCLISNVVTYVGARDLRRQLKPAAPVEHPTLSLTAEARARLRPFDGEIAARLSAGEDADAISASIARKAGVSAVQAELYLARDRQVA